MLNKSRLAHAKDTVLFTMPSLCEMSGTALNLSLNQDEENRERDAYEKGFESGEKAGFAMGEQRAMLLVERLEFLIKEVTTVKETLVRELEPQIVELAISTAKKILLKELTEDPASIVEMTKEALSRIERTGQVVIKINPALYDLFMKHKPDLLTIHNDIVFDVDSSVSRYGSVVRGPVEDIVTDLDEQLRNIIKDMGDRLAGD